MRVLLSADTLGGVWTYAAELAGALRERDVEVFVAALGRLPDRDQLAAMGGVEVFAHECALEWMPDPWDDVAASGDWLAALADELRPDIVHLNSYAHATLPWRSGVLVAAHSDVLSWFEAVRGAPAAPEWGRYRAVVEEGLQAADVVVAPSRAMLAALERNYVFASERAVIPNGRRPPQRIVAKEKCVVGVGRAWDEAKNLQALERLAPDLPWPVRVLGEGSRAGRVSAAAIEDTLARASIFALPARYEPFGLSVLEAALAECALVLGDIASLRELWDGSALFVDPADEEVLRHALLALAANDTRRLLLARAALRRARAFTPALMAQRYLDLYERVATNAFARERV